MLVDTGSAVYEQLAVPLGRAGVVLFQATSPADARLLAQELRPDCVVINLTLPKRVGDFAFALLRREGATASIPVVFLIDRLRWGRRANDAACDALVPAPWQAEQVVAALRRVVPRAEGWREAAGAVEHGGGHVGAW
jgi:DNA-binding response OmpR family regulator